ncbi:hypothetical protein HanRHA438_Chr00c06g0846071 [Helianthus annuus]|nr:hypothetical protein HanRHA438_Chr00c06g0846071 [Helianthus annuus]
MWWTLNNHTLNLSPKQLQNDNRKGRTVLKGVISWLNSTGYQQSRSIILG